MRVTAVVTHEAPWYVARCLEYEVATQGTSVEDAFEALVDAMTLYFSEAPPRAEPDEPPVIRSIEVPV
jgi:predicted RNase H-like HicB family nuclease